MSNGITALGSISFSDDDEDDDDEIEPLLHLKSRLEFQLLRHSYSSREHRCVISADDAVLLQETDFYRKIFH